MIRVSQIILLMFLRGSLVPSTGAAKIICRPANSNRLANTIAEPSESSICRKNLTLTWMKETYEKYTIQVYLQRRDGDTMHEELLNTRLKYMRNSYCPEILTSNQVNIQQNANWTQINIILETQKNIDDKIEHFFHIIKIKNAHLQQSLREVSCTTRGFDGRKRTFVINMSCKFNYKYTCTRQTETDHSEQDGDYMESLGNSGHGGDDDNIINDESCADSKLWLLFLLLLLLLPLEALCLHYWYTRTTRAGHSTRQQAAQEGIDSTPQPRQVTRYESINSIYGMDMVAQHTPVTRHISVNSIYGMDMIQQRGPITRHVSVNSTYESADPLADDTAARFHGPPSRETRTGPMTKDASEIREAFKRGGR